MLYKIEICIVSKAQQSRAVHCYKNEERCLYLYRACVWKRFEKGVHLGNKKECIPPNMKGTKAAKPKEERKKQREKRRG